LLSRKCDLPSRLENKKQIKVGLNTGTDKGKSHGIGAALIFPRGILRINFRNKGPFGVYHNENINLSFGLTKPKTTYTIIFKIKNDRCFGYVELENKKKIEVINIPMQALGGNPTSIRIGKMDKNHGSEDREAKDKTGRQGTSKITSFVVI